MHNFGTCVWRTDAQWQLPGKKSVSTQEKSDFAIALRFSKCRRKEYWISPKTCSSGRLHNHHLQLTPISAPLRVHLNSAHPYLDEIFFPIKLKIIWPPVVTLLSDLYSHITLATTLNSSPLAGALEPSSSASTEKGFLEFLWHQISRSRSAGADSQLSFNDCGAVQATQGTRAT